MAQRVDALIWFMRHMEAGRSGVSARAYCRQQGWPYSTFMAWRSRLCRELAGGRLRFERVDR